MWACDCAAVSNFPKKISISFTFQAIQKLYTFKHKKNMNLCYRVFCKFFGDFGVYLGGNSFF